MPIFQVISNIRHNGENLTPGQFIEAELATFEHLVKDEVMRLFHGATSVKEAQDIVAQEKQDAEAAQVQADAPAPAQQNTWGPKTEDPEVPAEPAPAPADAAPVENQASPDQAQKPEEVAPAQDKTEPQITGEEL